VFISCSLSLQSCNTQQCIIASSTFYLPRSVTGGGDVAVHKICAQGKRGKDRKTLIHSTYVANYICKRMLRQWGFNHISMSFRDRWVYNLHYSCMAKPNLFERLFPLLGILTSTAMLCITEINKHKKYTRHDKLEIFIFKPQCFDHW